MVIRLSGSTTQQLWMKSLASSLIPSQIGFEKSILPEVCSSTRSWGSLFALNGVVPDRIAYATTPMLQMSAGLPLYPDRKKSSGAVVMWAGQGHGWKGG